MWAGSCTNVTVSSQNQIEVNLITETLQKKSSQFKNLRMHQTVKKTKKTTHLQKAVVKPGVKRPVYISHSSEGRKKKKNQANKGEN